MPGNRNRLLVAAIVGGMLLAAWFAYRPALGGTFLLDDLSNLGELQDIHGAASAWQFVLGGTAGPAGRPIALATFLAQADAWQSGAAPFLTVNIAIHLLNACLLGAFLFRLTIVRGIARRDAVYVSLTSMALWLFMPLLASASLMVVQRMTTLCATFVLAGLNAWLFARVRMTHAVNKALAGMAIALGLASVLAVLTKESGALLPVLVFVIELTLLSPPSEVPSGKWKAWTAVFLWMPTLLLVGYVASRVPYSESVALMRGFTGWERLVTEAGILWQYLMHGFLPQPGVYGPFHDGYPVVRTLFAPLAALAVAGWLVLIGSALVWRRKYPVLSFAVLWFVAGHLLESTTIPIELYFEHRNYVPMIGPVYAFCHLAMAVPGQYRKLVRAAIPLYIVVNALFLYSLASLWGNPDLATRYWHEHDRRSTRAVTTMATRQIAVAGPQATLATLNGFVRDHPESAFIGIPALNLSCIISPDADHRDDAESLAKALPKVDFSYTTVTMLSELYTTVDRTGCKGVDDAAVEALARSLLENPRYRSSSGYRQYHHELLARMARAAGETDLTVEHLRKAVAIRPTTELNMMMVTTLVSAGRFDEARNFIESVRDNAPWYPPKRYLWHHNLEELHTYVDRVAASAKSGSVSADAPGAGRHE